MEAFFDPSEPEINDLTEINGGISRAGTEVNGVPRHPKKSGGQQKLPSFDTQKCVNQELRKGGF